jgi:hypothetical protein
VPTFSLSLITTSPIAPKMPACRRHHVLVFDDGLHISLNIRPSKRASDSSRSTKTSLSRRRLVNAETANQLHQVTSGISPHQQLRRAFPRYACFSSLCTDFAMYLLSTTPYALCPIHLVSGYDENTLIPPMPFNNGHCSYLTLS